MKLIKVAFLFFCIYHLFLFHSCNKNVVEKKKEKPIIDSVDVFILKMKDEIYDFKTRVNNANKALQKIKNHKLDSRISEILEYKIYFLGNLKQYDSAIYTSKKLLQKAMEKNDSVFIGRSYSKLAYYYGRNQQNDSAYYYYNLIKDEYLKYSDSITNGNNLLGMAIIEKSNGDYISSEYTGS